MILNLTGKTTQHIYDGTNSRYARILTIDLQDKARRLLDQVNAAPDVTFLRIPPGNRLEKLRGELFGFWSIRINNQWRIIFRWEGKDAMDVEIIDYHR